VRWKGGIRECPERERQIGESARERGVAREGGIWATREDNKPGRGRARERRDVRGQAECCGSAVLEELRTRRGGA